MLRANGQTDCVGPDPLVGQLLRRELGMGGGGRVDNQRLHVRHVRQQGKHLQVVDKPVGLRLPPLDL